MSQARAVAPPLRTTLEMIRVTHTVFALPFAILAAVLAAGGWPDLATLGKIVLAMIAARSAAMAQNRLADREIDAANPRTASRALPAGTMSVGYVRAFLVVSVVLFLLAAASLHRLTLLLAPVTLAVLFLYSYTKRFTALCHLVLGLCLAMAPVERGSRSAETSAPPRYLGLSCSSGPPASTSSMRCWTKRTTAESASTRFRRYSVLVALSWYPPSSTSR